MKIVIPGGSGQVGTVLSRAFVAAGHEVVVLSRAPAPVPAPVPLRTALWDGKTAGAWGTRVGLPATKWMLAVGSFFLRTETELILKSRRVVPGRLRESGFEFDFPIWTHAAADLCSRWRQERGRD